MRRFPPRFVALLSFGVVALLASGSVAGATTSDGNVVRAAGGWGQPAVVLSGVGAGLRPHMVVAPDGRAFVALGGLRTGAVAGARIGADGTIGRSQIVVPADEHPHHLDLGISSSGTVSAAYTSSTGRGSRVLLREGMPGRGFGSPVQISPAGVTATLFTFRETPDGFAVALLCVGAGRRCTYSLYARAPGGRFRNVTELPADARHVAIAVAADHRMIAVWDGRRSNGTPCLRGLDWRWGARPTAPYTVAGRTDPGWLSAPQAAVLAGGSAVVVWAVPLTGGRAAVDAISRSADGRFSPVQAVTNGRDGHDTGQHRLSAQNGSVLLTTDEATRHGRYRAVLRSWTAAHGFGQPQIGSPSSSDAFDPFAAAGGGRTVLAWNGSSSDAQIEASTAASGGAFGPPATLSDPGLTVQSGSGPYLSIDQRGVALAVWIDYGRHARLSAQLELARLAR